MQGVLRGRRLEVLVRGFVSAVYWANDVRLYYSKAHEGIHSLRGK